MIEDPWKCKKTGNCCRKFVYSGPEIRSKQKIDSIVKEMEELGFPEEKINQVRENRTVPALGGEPLKRCIFLKDNLCQIYEIRPRQCREYPLEIESEDSNIVILIDLDCPRAEKIKKAIEKGNISRWLEKILENKEIEEIKLRSFYEEKITSYYYKP